MNKDSGRKKLKTVFDFVSFDSIPHEDIKSLEIERYVSTARLVAKKKDENEPNEELIRFSLGIANKLDSFTRHFNDFKDGKPAEYSERVDEELFCPKCGSRYPDPEHKVCPRCMDKGSVFKRLLGFFKFYKNKLIAYFAMLIISTVFSVLSPYVGTKLLYDNVLTPGVDANLFGEVGLVLAVIILARVASLLINIGQSYIVAGIIPWVVYDLKVRIFSAMQRLSVSFYTSKQTGSLMTRVNRDSNNIYWFFVDGAPSVVVNALMFIGILIIMFYMNWQLSLIVLVMIPLLLFLYRIIQRAFRKLHLAFLHLSRMSHELILSGNYSRCR